MTNISKKLLKSKQLDQLFTQLSQLVANSNAKTAHLMLTDLLGYEERVMLAKRLAAIVMLSRGNTQYKTAQVLKISTSTTAKIQTGIKLGRYKHLTGELKKNLNLVLELLEAVDDILHLGGILPHYGGTKRYKKPSL